MDVLIHNIDKRFKESSPVLDCIRILDVLSVPAKTAWPEIWKRCGRSDFLAVANISQSIFRFHSCDCLTQVVVKAWPNGSNMLMQHHPTLLNPCCTRLATMLHDVG